jgi:hypothetical protein
MAGTPYTESEIRQNVYDHPAKAIRILDTSGLAGTEDGWLEFGEVDIASNNELVVVEYTVPALKKFTLLNITAGGDGDAKFRLEIAGTTKMVFRNNVAEKSVEKQLLKGVNVAAGAVVKIYAFNESNKTRHYEASIYGVLNDA